MRLPLLLLPRPCACGDPRAHDEKRRACGEQPSIHVEFTGRKRRNGGKAAQPYPNESSSLLIVLFNSLSVRRRFSILLIECSTVV